MDHAIFYEDPDLQDTVVVARGCGMREGDGIAAVEGLSISYIAAWPNVKCDFFGGPRHSMLKVIRVLRIPDAVLFRVDHVLGHADGVHYLVGRHFGTQVDTSILPRVSH